MANYNIDIAGEGRQKVSLPPIRKPDAVIDLAEAIRQMTLSGGWQEVERIIRGDLEQAKGVLEDKNKPLDEIRFAQGQIAALRGILALPQAFEIAGEQARKLKEKK